MIAETLQKLGFNEKEAEIYLEILKLGRATPARIAQNTGINRTTVYSCYKNLVKKRVIVEDLGHKYTYLVALPPENLDVLLEKQKKRLETDEKLVGQAVKELAELPANTQYSIPKIRFVEELDLEDFLYKRSDEWNKNLKQHDSTWWGFQDHTLIDHYKQWVLDYWKKFKSSEGILEKVVSNQTETEKEMLEKAIAGRDVRFWSKNAEFTSSFWVGGDYIIMVYTANRPFYLIEIHNPVMAYNLREVFKGLWEEQIRSK
ncbi:MAG: helix-turn-helix domain-containing protein [Parcubacteria group bacterium]|jgi:predicted transcriptional regulator